MDFVSTVVIITLIISVVILGISLYFLHKCNDEVVENYKSYMETSMNREAEYVKIILEQKNSLSSLEDSISKLPKDMQSYISKSV